jgi:hypothetical protein
MNTVKSLALGAGLLGASLFAVQAGAQTIADFKTTPITNGIFTFTYIDDTTGLDPTSPVAGGSPPAGSFPAIAPTNLPDDVTVNVNVLDLGDFVVATFNLGNTGQLSGSGVTDTIFNLSYTIELYAGDPATNPDERLDIISIGADISDTFDNATGAKWIFGQNTAVVNPATFKAVVNDPGVGTTNCGVCRKFVITDVFNTQASGSGAKGIISSVTNNYTVVVPGPAPIALFGAGLLGLGILRRVCK